MERKTRSETIAMLNVFLRELYNGSGFDDEVILTLRFALSDMDKGSEEEAVAYKKSA